MAFEGRIAPLVVEAGVSSGTVDAVRAGFGTVQAAIVVLSGSTTDQIATPEPNLRFSFGFTDGVHQDGVIAIGADGGEESTVSSGAFYLDRCVAEVGNGAFGRMQFDSWITDGVRLSYTNAFQQAYRGYVVLLKGAANAEVIQWRSAGALSPIVLAGAFKPHIVLFASHMLDFNGFGWNTYYSHGFAVRGAGDSISQCAHGYASNSFGADVRVDARASEDVSTGTNFGKRAFVTGWNADGFDLGQFGSAQQGMCIAIELPAGQEAILGDGLTAVTPGAFNFPTAYSSGSQDTDFFLFTQNRLEGREDHRGAKANSWSLGAVDSTLAQSVVEMLDTHGAPTSESSSLFSDSHAALIHSDGTGTTAEKVAAATGMTGGNVTLNYTTADATARWGCWLAIQSGAAGPPPEDVEVALPTAASIARGLAPSIAVQQGVEVGLPSLSLALRGYTPGVSVGADANVQLPARSLPLNAYVGVISIPNNVEIDLLTANLDLKVYAPVARTTEHVGSYLVTAPSVLVAFPPAVVIEGEVGIALPTASLAVNATAPQVSSGNVINSTLSAARVGLTGHPPGTFVEFDVQTALPAARNLGTVYAPGTYLAGDKISTPSSARLRLMAAAPRIAVGDPATMAPKDGGALGPVLAEVVVPTMNQKVVP